MLLRQGSVSSISGGSARRLTRQANSCCSRRRDVLSSAKKLCPLSTGWDEAELISASWMESPSGYLSQRVYPGRSGHRDPPATRRPSGYRPSDPLVTGTFAHWHIDPLPHWSICPLAYRPIGPLAHRSIGSLAHLPIGPHTHRPIGPLAHRPIDPLTHLPIHHSISPHAELRDSTGIVAPQKRLRQRRGPGGPS